MWRAVRLFSSLMGHTQLVVALLALGWFNWTDPWRSLQRAWSWALFFSLAFYVVVLLQLAELPEDGRLKRALLSYHSVMLWAGAPLSAGMALYYVWMQWLKVLAFLD